MAAAFVLAAVLFSQKGGKELDAQEREVKTPYGIIRYFLLRKRVKNINLRIKSDGSVQISAGMRVPIKVIEGVILERSQWIIRCISEQQRKNERQQNRLFLWGIPLETTSVQCLHGEKESCAVADGKAVFRMVNPEDNDRRNALWLEYLRGEAQRVFVPLYEQWSARFENKYGTKKQRLTIKPMTSRWGSRSRKTERIALNLYLAEKPKEYLEYTIVHELCHLLRMDHSKQFHQLVEENLPGAYRVEHRMRHESPLRH